MNNNTLFILIRASVTSGVASNAHHASIRTAASDKYVFVLHEKPNLISPDHGHRPIRS